VLLYPLGMHFGDFVVMRKSIMPIGRSTSTMLRV
jgi:hypothetical protein